MANLSEFVKEHKTAVVVGGALVGLALVGGLLLKKCDCKGWWGKCCHKQPKVEEKKAEN